MKNSKKEDCTTNIVPGDAGYNISDFKSKGTPRLKVPVSTGKGLLLAVKGKIGIYTIPLAMLARWRKLKNK